MEESARAGGGEGSFSRRCAEMMRVVACRVCDPQVLSEKILRAAECDLDGHYVLGLMSSRKIFLGKSKLFA